MKLLTIIFFALISSFSFCQFSSPDTMALDFSNALQSEEIDIDLDGNIDLVIRYYDGVYWFKNLGNGIFSRAKEICSSCYTPTILLPIDLDNDLDIDFVIAKDNTNGVFWLENDGSGNFDTTHVIDNISNVHSSYILEIEGADMDNDNDIDLLLSYGQGDNLNYYENTGGNIFAAPVEIVSFLRATDIQVLDLDNDSDLDIVYVEKMYDEFGWVENQGNGTFSVGQPLGSTNAPIRLISFDIENDGDPDFISSPGYDGGSQQNIMLWKNLGNGSFDNIILDGQDFQSSSIDLIDYDDDGDEDILIAERFNDHIYVYSNLNNGSFDTNPIEHHTGIDEIELSNAADFNNDGLKDIAYIDGNNVFLDFNIGNGSYKENGPINNYIYGIGSIETGDLDNDGNIDLLVGGTLSGQLSWYQNLGNDNFTGRRSISTFVECIDVETHDLDQDGDLDIIASSGHTQFGADLLVYENLGNGIFDDPITLTSASTEMDQVQIADINLDGEKDIIVPISDWGLIWYFENTGNFTFASEVELHSGNGDIKSIETTDLDNDGDQDILAAIDGQDKIVWFENTGGSLSTPIDLTTSADGANHVNSYDMDNDGDADVLFCSVNDGKIGWIENLGGGNFSSENIISTINSPQQIKAADIDSDGDLDIYVDYYYALDWYENTGNLNFNPSPYSIHNSAFGFSSTDSDFDNDGDLDIAYAGASGATLELVQNETYYDLQIEGDLFFDLDTNGVMDSTDVPFPQQGVYSTPQSDYVFTSQQGHYLMNFSDSLGSYTISTNLPQFWNITSDSSSYTILIDTTFTALDSLDFGCAPDTIFDSLTVDVVGGFPRCNSEVNYWLNITNSGTTIPSGYIKFSLDDSLVFVNSNQTPDSIIGNDYYWSYDSLFYFDTKSIQVTVEMPDFNSINDSIFSGLSAFVDSIPGIEQHADTLKQVVLCAYDPNDKSVFPKGAAQPGYIPLSTEKLEYLIRFQNTGNDTALTVAIHDQLDDHFDIQSLTPLSSSHDVDISVDQNGLVIFKFENIMLPDSNVNFLGSQGYIKFEVSLKENLPSGTIVKNHAEIYFDQNPAIITNYTQNTLFECNTLLDGISVNNISCENDFIQGNINGAPIETTFLWYPHNDTVNSSQLNWQADTSGTFNLNVNGFLGTCSDDTTLTFSLIPEILGFENQIKICPGDSVLIFGSYEHIPSLYSDTLNSIASGCDSINKIDLSFYEVSPITLSTNSNDTICITHGIIELITNNQGGSFNGSGVTGNQFDPAVAGFGAHDITYDLTDSNNCLSSDTITLYVENCLGTEYLDPTEVLIRPNPFQENTKIFFTNGLPEDNKIVVYNSLGQIVHTIQDFSGKQLKINKSDLGVGTFYLFIKGTGENIIFRTKLVTF